MQNTKLHVTICKTSKLKLQVNYITAGEFLKGNAQLKYITKVYKYYDSIYIKVKNR